MSKSPFVVICALLIAATVQLSHAGTYYVDPNNGDDNNPGSIDQPWRTIQRSVKYGFPSQVRQPGDTVYLRGGLYTGNSNYIDVNGQVSVISGTEAAPITIKAYPGETPVVSGARTPYRGVLLKNLAWWVFDGITYSDCYQSVWIENCSHFLFKNCTFKNMPVADQGYANVQLWATVTGASQYNIFRNCIFREWGFVDANANDIGVHISIGDETNDRQMYYNLVEGCTFIHGGHDHFQLNDAYNVIRNNLFINEPWMPGPASLPGNGGVPVERNPYGLYGNRHTKPGDAGDLQQDMRNVWEKNTFIYTGPPPDDYGAFGIELGTQRSIYRFNVIAYSLAAGLYFNTSGTTSLSSKNTVYNNTIYGNGLSHVFGGQGMKDYSYGVTMSTFENRRTGNFLINNIILKNLPGNIDPVVLTYQEVRGNLSNDAVDPLFESTAGRGWKYDANNMPDFRLRAGSPCVDAGTWLAYATRAGTGTTLVVDNSLYFSDGNKIVEGDTIQLQGQKVRSTVIRNDWQNNTLYLSAPLTWTAGQGVALAYFNNAPDQGAFESALPLPPSNLRIP